MCTWETPFLYDIGQKFNGNLWPYEFNYITFFFLLDAKAQEAAASGYYNPSAPHNVHMVTTPSCPPAYDEVTKKNN